MSTLRKNFGVGFFITRGPSVSDPAGISKWQICICLGTHVWYWHIGEGPGNINWNGYYKQ